MKSFMTDDFLLQNETAKHLYHDYAKDMPIIDYHCHLPPDEIAADKQFENITRVWLNGDHYKWRAMRTNGVDESYITGDKPDKEKFQKWAETVPYTLRNPLYHWTHMELKKYFGITELLEGSCADRIYDETSEVLNYPDYSVRNLLLRSNVVAVCTTDDPTDDLQHHKNLAQSNFDVLILPTWRPDKAMAIDKEEFPSYVKKVEEVSDVSITTLQDYLDALKQRHDYFAEVGCKLSDHGLEHIYATDYTEEEVASIFEKRMKEEPLSREEQDKFRSAMLVWFAEWDHEKGWTQQFHLGAIRNNNDRMMRDLGPDTGFDSIGDYPMAQTMSKFFGGLDGKNKLTKTILYNLNPADNELFATMVGNYNDGTIPGKMQYGSGWWFLDQKDGMTRQMNALSNMGLISRFVGMLTDSRSFLSYSRHEYFRRLICNLFGQDIEHGELPNDIQWTGKIIQDICFNNAKNYFNFELKEEAVNA